MNIYWIKNKQRCGPTAVPDIISLLQVGELTPETLGWHKGCAQWAPLRELPALADFLNKEKNTLEDEEPAPTPIPEETSGTTFNGQEAGTPVPAAEHVQQEKEPAEQDFGTTQRIYLPSPVTRLLARLVDYTLYVTAFYGVLYLRQVPYDAALLLSVNPLLWLPMVVLEALLLSTWGTTPGKALMGIRVTTFGEVRGLSFLRAFWRSLMVLTLGMGLMIPQIMLLMLALEFWMLRRRGITPWDARCSTLPTQHQPALPSRYVLAVITIYACAVIAASCVQPWFPHMVKDIEQKSPELARTLSRYMPKAPAAPAPAAAPAEQAPATPAAPHASDTELPGI